MKEIIHLLSRFVFAELTPSSSKGTGMCMRLAVNLGALFFLISGYVLGCKALYHYIQPIWGEVFSLLALCILFTITSLVFFIAGWFLRPKPSTGANFISTIEKVVNETPTTEIVKKLASHVSPKMLVSVCAIAAVGSYLANSKKSI